MVPARYVFLQRHAHDVGKKQQVGGGKTGLGTTEE